MDAPTKSTVTSPRVSMRSKRRGSIADSCSRWAHHQFFPVFFKLAYIGLWVLFLVYKFLLSFYEAMILVKYRATRRIRGASFDTTKKRIVVVGGGYAGTYAAKQLEFDFDVTLIDMKDYYEFTPSRLRILVEPAHAYKVQVRYESILSNATIVTDKVENITPEGNNVSFRLPLTSVRGFHCQ